MRDGLTFVGVSRLDLFDANGNLVAGDLRATELGRALKIEVIADLP